MDKQFRSYFQVNKCDFYKDAIEALQGIYDYLGTLNDLYVNYEYYLNEGDKKSAEAAKVKADNYWNDTVNWMKASDIPNMFGCLLASVQDL